MSKLYNLIRFKIKHSHNGNLHLILIINSNYKLSDFERICIQIFVGSDLKREELNFKRTKNGGKLDDWNILFDRKIDKNISDLMKCHNRIYIGETVYTCCDDSPFKCDKHGTSVLKKQINDIQSITDIEFNYIHR